MNRSLEIDLAMVLRQNDYLDSRVASKQWSQMPYKRDMKLAQKKEDDMLKKQLAIYDMNFPDQSGVNDTSRFVWETMPLEARFKRANERPHIKTNQDNMEETLTNKAFDFYGCYVKISEAQKFKFAETKLVKFYKDLCIEAIDKNIILQSEVESSTELNRQYEQDREQMRQSVISEKQKTQMIKSEMQFNIKLYE